MLIEDKFTNNDKLLHKFCYKAALTNYDSQKAIYTLKEVNYDR